MKLAVFRKSALTGLKAITSYVTILEVQGRGALRAIRWSDPDNLTQDEHLKITIDGDVLVDGVRDCPQTAEYLNLLLSAMQGAPIQTTDEAIITNVKLPFHDSLKIEYYRATAGTTGLSISCGYHVKDYFA